MKRLHLALLTGMFIIPVGSSWGQAVSVDATSLIRRLDALESRVGSVETRRAAASSGAPSLGAAGYTASDVEQRLGELEQESSQVRGTSERALQAIELLAKRFDSYTKDIDMRMADLEARVDTLAEKQTAAAAAPAPVVAPVAAAEPAAEVAPAAAPAAAATKPAAVTGIPATMSASDHYNKAYAFLTATDYKNAQVWFEEFLKRHPKDALADNAYYWLGEVYLVQNNPSAAVLKFRDGIKSFPKGSKVTANLFKMGVALEQLKQPKLAKAAWDKLLKDYPTAPEAARAKDKLVNLKIPA